MSNNVTQANTVVINLTGEVSDDEREIVKQTIRSFETKILHLK